MLDLPNGPRNWYCCTQREPLTPTFEAIHEAGHAVAAVLCNIPIAFAKLAGGDPGEVTQARVATWTITTGDSLRSHQSCVVSQAAGAVEAMYEGCAPANASFSRLDDDNAVRTCLTNALGLERILGNPRLPDLIATALKSDTTKIMLESDVSGTVLKVAHLLSNQRFLFGPALTRWIKEMPEMSSKGLRIQTPVWYWNEIRPGVDQKQLAADANEAFDNLWEDFNQNLQSGTIGRDDLPNSEKHNADMLFEDDLYLSAK